MKNNEKLIINLVINSPVFIFLLILRKIAQNTLNTPKKRRIHNIFTVYSSIFEEKFPKNSIRSLKNLSSKYIINT